MNADAFIHLPELRTRVTHPEKSLLRLTPEMFSMWEKRARAAGWPAGWRLSDELIEALLVGVQRTEELVLAALCLVLRLASLERLGQVAPEAIQSRIRHLENATDIGG